MKRILGFGLGWKWQGLGKDLGMTSHSGNKEEGIFFSFQTTKPRKKENSSKNLTKTKEKERAKNQAVTPSTTRMLLGEGFVGVNHRAIPTSTQRMTIKEIHHASNLLHNGYHTCMLRDLQTSTQAFLKFIITQLARLWYYHLHISKQLSSIKLILVFNALKRKLHISWTPSILTLSKLPCY